MSVSGMKRLSVFAFREDADSILRRLIRLRCVEVQKSLCADDEETKARRRNAEEACAVADAALKEIRTVLPELTKYSGETKGFGRSRRVFDGKAFSADGSRARAERTVAQTTAAMARREAIAAERANLWSEIKALTPWAEFDLPLDQLQTVRTKTVLGSCPTSLNFLALEAELAEQDAVAERIFADRFGVYLAVTYLKESESEILSQLASVGFAASVLPDGAGTAQQRLTQLELEREALETAAQDLEDEMRDLAEYLDLVEILHDVIDTDRTVALMHQRLAQTETCSVLEGWIPEAAEEAVKRVLSKYDCAYEMREPRAEEDPPVLLRNNRFSANFEWVVGMYSYPKYGRFDPTAIMSVFYFLIFGLMFADVGYGLLLVLGGFGGARLRSVKPHMKRMLSMFGYCGLSAMLMGVLFGGWFGDLPTAVMQNLLGVSLDTEAGHFFGSGLWFNPLDNPLGFLILALAVGGVHLIAGMATRFYILCRDGKAAEAICTIVPYWILFAGLLMLLITPVYGKAVSIAGAVLIVLLNGYGARNPFMRLFRGLGGLYGLINYASDLLSYSRILALGLVAAVIAKVINMITAMGTKGVFGAVVMTVVLILGHLLNLAINVLGSFVHTSRLQYMEFFGKFYEDGGRAFEPACPTEAYSEEYGETFPDEIQEKSSIKK